MKSVACLCLLVVFVATDPTVSPQLTQIFNSVDLDKDGHLTLAEFDAFYDKFDKDGDGNINLADYIAASKLPLTQAKPLFNYYDQDKDGSVTKKDVARLFNDYDENGDNEVPIGEFAHHYAQFLKSFASAVGK